MTITTHPVDTTAASPGARPGGQGAPDRAWTIVARREITAKLTDRAFLVGTLLTTVIVIAILVIQGIMGSRTQTFTMAVTSADASMANAVARAAHATDDKVVITPTTVAGQSAAEAALRDGTADVWLHRGADGWVLTGDKEVDSTLSTATVSAVRDVVLTQNAAAAGTSEAALTAGSNVTKSLLQGDAARQDFGVGLGIILGILFYISSMTFGMTLAGSVVEEKSSRIVEIITTKIPVRALLTGKILGNAALAFAQMALYAVVGLVGLTFTDYDTYLPSVSSTLGWFFAFFVVGFLLLACLWAVVGALSSRQEDLQSTAMPVTMLMLVMYLGVFFLHGTALTVASYIPPLSAILMPLRVAQGVAAWWEPLVALGLLLLAAAAVVAVAERLYRRALLQTQGRLSWRQAWNTAE